MKYGYDGINSNNGSTAHDGMYMLRVGSSYWDCEGPVVADVNDCYSISIGVSVGEILDTTGGKRAAFYFAGEGANKQYVIDGLTNGKNIEQAISSTANTYYMNLQGKLNIEGNVQKIDWGDMT